MRSFGFGFGSLDLRYKLSSMGGSSMAPRGVPHGIICNLPVINLDRG